MSATQASVDRDLVRLKQEFLDKVEAELREKIDQEEFDYTVVEDFHVLHVVAFDFFGWVAVIGQPGCGDYEWFVRYGNENNPKYSHSNAGYGCPASALRDGLTFALN